MCSKNKLNHTKYCIKTSFLGVKFVTKINYSKLIIEYRNHIENTNLLSITVRFIMYFILPITAFLFHQFIILQLINKTKLLQ